MMNVKRPVHGNAGRSLMEEALHQAHPGRQCRSVSFDDGSRRVIATDLDPEVDPRMLKPTTGRVPTPRPSKTECNAREADDSCDSSPSRPESSNSRGSVSSAASESAPKVSVAVEETSTAFLMDRSRLRRWTSFLSDNY
ncbi:hypothetical protein HPB47_001349 [Ixodes persulcatus]|uniref:Uncharacterized protein n=1 Tax=Ixodes persulcatus TaxID=34615 RepID=A0AC60PQG8_IXOPE|nr:hypothetical protein HPB47_001349 [Ixodes persulcatus]